MAPRHGLISTPTPNADADGVYVQQIGSDMDGFFASWEREVLPQLLQKYEAGVSPTLTPF